VAAGWDPRALTEDAYALAQQSGEERYWNVRLVRADLAPRYEGVTHEHLVVADGARHARLPQLCVRDLNDGGSRGDKFERDRRLLRLTLMPRRKLKMWQRQTRRRSPTRSPLTAGLRWTTWC
jgi:hypothetical protein